MATFYGAVDLSKNELRQAQVQNLASAPASPVLGQIYYNTGDGTLYYCTNVVGPIWTAAKAGAGATPASSVTTAAIGDAAVVGTGSNFAREDHKHGMPAFGSVTVQGSFGMSSTNGASTSIARADHTHGTPLHDAAAHASINLSALAQPLVDFSWNNKHLINLADPVSPQDAATKYYVDSVAQGLDAKPSVRVASATATNYGTLSGNLTVDSVTTVNGDRVLLKDQTTPSTNGIWVVSSGAWTRPGDFDVWADVPGAFVFVEEGTTNADTGWVCTANAGGTLGTTANAWTQFSSAGSVTAGAGMTQAGNTLNVIAGDTTLTVAADDLRVNTSVIATVASLSSYATTASLSSYATTASLASYATTASLSSYTRKYAAALTGTGSPETVTHNLNTRDITLTVLNGSSPYTAIEVDWDATTVNTAVVRYNPNIGAGYRVVVVG